VSSGAQPAQGHAIRNLERSGTNEPMDMAGKLEACWTDVDAEVLAPAVATPNNQHMQ